VTASRGRDRLLWASESPLAPGEKPQPNLPMIYYSWNRIGLDLIDNRQEQDPIHYKGSYFLIRFPSWLLVLLTSILPGLWLLRRSQKRVDGNLCPVCSYDLRATPDRCPECGTVTLNR
jgi:hypothetical protein